MLSRTARRLEGAQRREAGAEPGFRGREPPPVSEARSVPAASSEPTEEKAEDDQEDPEPERPEDQDEDPDDHEDCAYAHYVSPLSLEVAPEGLLSFDCLEQGLEIAFAKPTRAVALDDLEEERRTVLRGLREDLKQVPLLVAVGQDAEAT